MFLYHNGKILNGEDTVANVYQKFIRKNKNQTDNSNDMLELTYSQMASFG
jgi:hypothetical protein